MPGPYLGGHIVSVCQSTRCVSVSSLLSATCTGCLQDYVDLSLLLDHISKIESPFEELYQQNILVFHIYKIP